jgi:hypothetical protein
VDAVRLGGILTREELVVELARWYRDAVDPVFAAHNTGAGDGVVMMPATYTESFREFERCYRALKATHPGWFRHFQQRYTLSRRAQKLVKRRPDGTYLTGCVTGRLEALPTNWAPLVTTLTDPAAAGRKHKRRTPQIADALVVMEIWDRDTDLARVRAAVRWVAGEFRGEPCLPREIFEASAA